MKRLLIVLTTVAVSSAAFAQTSGPIRQNNRCWVPVDQRGFGFWDKCASSQEIIIRNRETGRTAIIDEAVTRTDDSSSSGGSGSGGGGGR